MCESCPEQVYEVDSDCLLIAVACPKCREVALYTSTAVVARVAIHHSKQCGTSAIVVAELMPLAEKKAGAPIPG